MKFNFGHGIVIFFICFMSVSIFQVVKSRQYEHALIKEDYYIDDLALEDMIHKKRNVQKLKGFMWTYNEMNDSLIIHIPNIGKVKGQLQLISPVKKSEDINLPVRLVADRYAIDMKSYRRGKWNCVLAWEESNVQYLFDTSLVLL